jgi:GntR family transcriptional regulator, sialic acid-inducible nan operon repressor
MITLKRPRLSKQIAEILEQQICSRELEAGDELPSERDLMRQFNVGRPAVREALSNLQNMGLVELKSGARARVVVPSPAAVMSSLAGSARYLLSDANGVRHFQEARLLFETGLVRDAAKLASAEDISDLKKALAANREAIGHVRRFEETDIGFHYAIAKIPRNPIYISLHGAILDWLVDQRRVSLNYPGQNRTAYEAHAAIFDAIEAKREDDATKFMREHLTQVADLYWKVKEAEA